jgi:hypothetical protein
MDQSHGQQAQPWQGEQWKVDPLIPIHMQLAGNWGIDERREAGSER